MATRDTSGRLRVGMFEKVRSELDPSVEYSVVSGTAKRATFTTGTPTPDGPTGKTFEARTVANPRALDYAAAEQGVLGMDPFAVVCAPIPSAKKRGR